MSRVWAIWEAAQADYERLREAVIVAGRLPDDLRTDARVRVLEATLDCRGVGALKRLACSRATGDALVELDWLLQVIEVDGQEEVTGENGDGCLSHGAY